MTNGGLKILDLINSIIEIVILVPFLYDIYYIVKVKTSISINIMSQAIWLAYCVYGGVYFFCLGQYMSTYSSAFWCIGYVVKIAIVFKYRAEPHG